MMGSSPICLTLMYRWGYPLLGAIAAIVLVGLAGLLFLFGWVLPRALGRRQRESSTEEGGVPTNRFGNIEAWATFWRRSSGGIELKAGISTGPEDVDEDGADEDEDFTDA